MNLQFAVSCSQEHLPSEPLFHIEYQIQRLIETALVNTSHFIGFFILKLIPSEFLTFLLCLNTTVIENTTSFDKSSVHIPALSHVIIALKVYQHEVEQVAFYCSFSRLGSAAGFISFHAALNYLFHYVWFWISLYFLEWQLLWRTLDSQLLFSGYDTAVVVKQIHFSCYKLHSSTFKCLLSDYKHFFTVRGV